MPRSGDMIGALKIPLSVLIVTFALTILIGTRIISMFWSGAIDAHDTTVVATATDLNAQIRAGIAIMLPLANAVPGILAVLLASADRRLREAIGTLSASNLAFYAVTMPVIGLALSYLIIILMPMPEMVTATDMQGFIDLAWVLGGLAAQLPYAALLILRRKA